MRRSLLLLAIPLLTACQAAVAPPPRTASAVRSPVLEDPTRVKACDEAEHQLLRTADGRTVPMLLCN
jgi:hypothetical protein